MERKRPKRSLIKQSIFPISVFRVELPACKKVLSAPRAVKHGSCLHANVLSFSAKPVRLTSRRSAHIAATPRFLTQY